MFGEIFDWLTTPCPAEARKLGYLREAIAIKARHRRHRQAWQPHLDRTKALIERSMAAAAKRRRAVVLGSGPLLDVPVASLARTFEAVDLIDLVHPKAARHIAAAHANVTLRTEDISGVSVSLAAMPKDAAQAPQLGSPPMLSEDTDFVVSVNLLSQLPDIPAQWLGAKTALIKPARKAFARRLVRCHLDWLLRLDALVCLVTDVERRYVERDGTELPAWDSLQGVTLPPATDIWTWDVAPAGETHPDLAVRMTVHGFADFAAAAQRGSAARGIGN